MLEFTENLGRIVPTEDVPSLTLDYDQRSRIRQRSRLDDGEEIGVILPHGSHRLAGGDLLRSADGRLAVVRCRAEEVITAWASDWPSLSRAAYHLGNRHVALELGDLWLRFQPDPVLEKLATDLGLKVRRETAVFEPEGGAGGHSHKHVHADKHEH